MYKRYETSYPINVHPELVFQKLNPLVHLDLHWRLFPRGFGAKLDFDALWQRRQTVMVAGKVYELACTGLGTVIQFLWRW